MGAHPGDEVAGFRVGGWHVDPSSGELSDGQSTVRVRPKVMQLLITLAARAGEVVSRRDLLDEVWPDVIVTDATLAVTVRELREAVGDDAGEPRVVETVPRRGYRLVAAVTSAPPPPATGSAAQLRLVGDGVSLPLRRGRFVIGRGDECDVRIDSSVVSRRHAAIAVDHRGVVLTDLGSKNGTFVNGRRVEDRVSLSTGDELLLGRYAAVLRVVPAGDTTRTELSGELPAVADS